ncbi:MAG: MlaD family protein [Myxococcaceae bacterium]
MDERRLEIKVGAFLLAGIVGVLGLLWLMGEFQFAKAAALDVLFSHTGNVVKGAPVKLGGVQVGRVEEISLDLQRRDEQGQPLPVGMRLSLEPAARDVLHQDALVTVATVGPLGEPYLELYPGAPSSPLLPPGQSVRGMDAPRLDLIALRLSTFLDSASQVLDENPEALGTIVTGVSGLTKNVDAVLSENREDIRVLTGELAKAAKDLRSLAELARQNLQPGSRGDRLLDDATVTARALRNDVPQLSGDARRLLARLAQFSEQFTEEDAQRLKVAIEKYSAAGEKLEGLATRGERLLAQIEAGEGTLGQIQKDPQLYQDVKALVEDLRKHPWKILWKD